MASSRWIRPEVYPLFAATTGVAVGICGMQLFRNICTNPEVKVTKENRTTGVLENFAEGERYAEHDLRKFVRNKTPQIMPSSPTPTTERRSSSNNITSWINEGELVFMLEFGNKTH